ncbi:hypothetical protein [Frondihabitans peucedani]|uniref:SnoaL-like domain-containing protein n=1 Tax=Frondihabitans peucedani TaxID=598626 RepID=A0ABP8E5R9_9MICO
MSEKSFETVRSYYAAYRAGSADQVTAALSEVVDDGFVLESPLVEARLGGPATGSAALSMAAAVAPLLGNADIEALYARETGDGVVALIHFPTPAGPVTQSEHFDLDPASGRITRLRSYYDPRALLGLSRG